MKIDILTIFPDMFKGPFDESMIKRAQEKKLVEICYNAREAGMIDDPRTSYDLPVGA